MSSFVPNFIFISNKNHFRSFEIKVLLSSVFRECRWCFFLFQSRFWVGLSFPLWSWEQCPSGIPLWKSGSPERCNKRWFLSRGLHPPERKGEIRKPAALQRKKKSMALNCLKHFQIIHGVEGLGLEEDTATPPPPSPPPPPSLPGTWKKLETEPTEDKNFLVYL